MEILKERGSGTDGNRRLAAPLVAGIIARRRVEILRRGLFSGSQFWRYAAIALVTHYVMRRMSTSSRVLLRLRIDPGDHLEIRGLTPDELR